MLCAVACYALPVVTGVGCRCCALCCAVWWPVGGSHRLTHQSFSWQRFLLLHSSLTVYHHKQQRGEEPSRRFFFFLSLSLAPLFSSLSLDKLSSGVTIVKEMVGQAYLTPVFFFSYFTPAALTGLSPVLRWLAYPPCNTEHRIKCFPHIFFFNLRPCFMEL